MTTEEIEAGYAALRADIEQSGALSDECWQYLKMNSQPQFYKKKTTLIREGEHPTMTGFIIQGAAKSYYVSPKDGREVVTRLFVPTEICGPENFRLDESSSENIEFVKDSWLICTTYEHILAMYTNFPDFNLMYATQLEHHGRRQREKVLDLKMLTVSQRFEKLMANNPHYFNHFSIADIASYLGTERETLTRLRSKLYKK